MATRVLAAVLVVTCLSSSALAADPRTEAITAAAAAAEAAAKAAQAAAAAARAAAGIDASAPLPGTKKVTRTVKLSFGERMKLLGTGLAFFGAGLATGTSGVITAFLGLMVITNSNALPVHAISGPTLALFFGLLAVSSQFTNEEAQKRFREGAARIGRAWNGTRTVEEEVAEEVVETVEAASQPEGSPCQLELFPKP